MTLKTLTLGLTCLAESFIHFVVHPLGMLFAMRKIFVNILMVATSSKHTWQTMEMSLVFHGSSHTQKYWEYFILLVFCLWPFSHY